MRFYALVSILSISLFWSMTAQASMSRHQKNLERLLKPYVENQKKEAKSKQQCIQMTGNWQGSCTDELGDTYDETIKILQWEGCDSLEIDQRIYPIGGQLSEHSVSKKTTITNNIVRFEINQAGTGYDGVQSWEFAGNGQQLEAYGRGKFELVLTSEDEMVMTSQFRMVLNILDQTTINHTSQKCLYKKLPD
jgi:hypothetical protein